MIPNSREMTKSRVESFVFKGWVPTVGGRLSFELVGQTSHPSKTYPPINVEGERSRYIVCYQKRNLGDALFPSLLEFLRLNRSSLMFVCFASSSNVAEDDDASLEGRIMIFRRGGRLVESKKEY